MPSSPTIDAPDIGRIEIPEGYLGYDDYIERCCHILHTPQGTTTAQTPTWTLCGLVLRRRPHPVIDGAAFTCPTCERPRCPDCAHRYRGPR